MSDCWDLDTRQVCTPVQYVETLQEQLSDLQNETGTKRCACIMHKTHSRSAEGSEWRA